MLRHYKKTAVAVPSLENSLTMASERLQKIMAASGIASRRKAEEIIAAGGGARHRKGGVEKGGEGDAAIDGTCVGREAPQERGASAGILLHPPQKHPTHD